MKNILITGGFGYVGSRLATYLNSNGFNIFLGSRNINSKNSWDSGFNIKCTNWESEKSIIESCENMDIVIHAAGTNAFDSQMNPVTALQVNGINTGKLMQASILNFVNQFIYISNIRCY